MSGRVLVVDDEPGIVRLVAANLRQRGHQVAALDTGADDYVTKPFGVAELLARIRVVLRHGQEPDRPRILRLGNVEIDLGAQLVTRAGRPVRLTGTEYRLLELLATNAGRVCTHRFLLERVWGPTAVDRPHYLRVYVANLRRKLDDPAAPALLLTEPWTGYRLAAADQGTGPFEHDRN